MKIYPSKHTIATVSEVNTNEEIALGYLDSEFMEETIYINVNDDLTITEMKELLPYNTLNSLDVTLFDKDGNPLEKAEQEKMLIRQTAGNYL